MALLAQVSLPFPSFLDLNEKLRVLLVRVLGQRAMSLKKLDVFIYCKLQWDGRTLVELLL